MRMTRHAIAKRSVKAQSVFFPGFSVATLAEETHSCQLQPAQSAQYSLFMTLRSPSEWPATWIVKLAACLHSSSLQPVS